MDSEDDSVKARKFAAVGVAILDRSGDFVDAADWVVSGVLSIYEHEGGCTEAKFKWAVADSDGSALFDGCGDGCAFVGACEFANRPRVGWWGGL